VIEFVSTVASKLYAALSWLLIAFGVLHLASTVRIYDALSMPALWFVSGGILIVFGAALNLLNRAYGIRAPGLRVAAVFGNVVIAGVAATGGLVSRASLPQLVGVLGLYAGVILLSATRQALRPVSEPGSGPS
jgi:hypothetical protein